ASAAAVLGASQRKEGQGDRDDDQRRLQGAPAASVASKQRADGLRDTKACQRSRLAQASQHEQRGDHDTQQCAKQPERLGKSHGNLRRIKERNTASRASSKTPGNNRNR